MPIKCPKGGKPRYRAYKPKTGGKRRLAFCGDNVVENVPLKGKKRKRKK